MGLFLLLFTLNALLYPIEASDNKTTPNTNHSFNEEWNCVKFCAYQSTKEYNLDPNEYNCHRDCNGKELMCSSCCMRFPPNYCNGKEEFSSCYVDGKALSIELLKEKEALVSFDNIQNYNVCQKICQSWSILVPNRACSYFTYFDSNLTCILFMMDQNRTPDLAALDGNITSTISGPEFCHCMKSVPSKFKASGENFHNVTLEGDHPNLGSYISECRELCFKDNHCTHFILQRFASGYQCLMFEEKAIKSNDGGIKDQPQANNTNLTIRIDGNQECKLECSCAKAHTDCFECCLEAIRDLDQEQAKKCERDYQDCTCAMSP